MVKSIREQAVSERKKENYRCAFDLLHNSLKLVKDATGTESIHERMMILKELGVVYGIIRDDNPKVTRYFEEALKYARILTSTREIGNIEFNLGILRRKLIFSAQGKRLKQPALVDCFHYLDQSRSHLEKSLKAYTIIDDATSIREVFREQSILHQIAGDLYTNEGPEGVEYAKEEYSTAEVFLASAEGKTDTPIVERGNLAFRCGDLTEAIKVYQQCLRRSREKNLRLGEALASQNLGLALLEQYRQRPDHSMVEEIIMTLSHAADLAEETRGNIDFELFGKHRSGYFSEKVFLHDQLVDFLFSLGRYGEAYQWVERAKARNFLDLMSQTDNVDGDSDYPTQNILLDLRRIIPEGNYLIEYFLSDNGVYRFLIDSTGLKNAKKLPFETNDLLLQVISVRKEYSNPNYVYDIPRNGELRTGITFSWQSQSHHIFSKLVGDIWPEIEKAKQICIIPHHILHYLPFYALVVKETTSEEGLSSDAPRYWVEEGPPVAYSPSGATLVKLLSGQRRPISRLAAFIDTSLGGVRESSKYIRSISNTGDFIIYDGREGNKFIKSNLFREWPICNIMYLGTHGSVDVKDPLNSSIMIPIYILSASRDDSSLTAGQILTLSGSAPELVIMSACETGLSEPDPSSSDDLLGLNRALLARGVGGVICTLWKVPDNTCPEIDCGFLKRVVLCHQSGPSALAESMREFIRRARTNESNWSTYAHPYYWAAFIYSGDPRIIPP